MANIKLDENKYSPMKSPIDAESYSIEDYSSDSEWTPSTENW